MLFDHYFGYFPFFLSLKDLLRKMEPNVDPCEDFYTYACGGYEKSTPIPSNLQSVHVLLQRQEENTKFLKTMIENPKIRTYYSRVSIIIYQTSYIHTYTHTYIYIHIHTYIHTYTYTYIYIHIYIYIYTVQKKVL